MPFDTSRRAPTPAEGGTARRMTLGLAPGLALAMTLGACADATAPRAAGAPEMPSISASGLASATLVLDDASSRIAGAIGTAERRTVLSRLLEQLDAAVVKDDVAAAHRFLAAARAEVARGGQSVDAADLDALSIALDAVDAALPAEHSNGTPVAPTL